MNHPALVALVDADSTGLATLTFSFEKERFTVAGTSDVSMARQLIASTGARVTVVALRPPETQALGLIAELARAASAQRPVVVALGAPSSRQAALDAGATDYVDTPSFVRDVVLLARMWLQASAGARPGDDGGTEVTGSLDAWHGLYYVMRGLSAAHRSGVLQLARGKRKGEVKFTDGAVTAAQVRGLQSFPALHQLLLWTGADLTLKLRDVPKRTQFSATGPEILDECERFLRDVHHALRQIGSLQAVFARDTRHSGAAAAVIPHEVAPVARLLDGTRTLGDIIEDSPFRVFDTLRAVKQLIDRAVVIARAAGPAAAAATGSGAATAPSAPPRARTRTGPQATTAARVAPARELDAALHDRRGVAGDRRRVVHRTPTGFEKPAAKPAPAPIPLVVKKSPSGAFAAGEIRAPVRAPRLTPGRGAPAGRLEPSVMIKIDPPALSLDVPVPLPPGDSGRSSARVKAPATTALAAQGSVVAAPAPVAAVAPLSARQPAAPIRLKKVTKTPVAGAGGGAAAAAASGPPAPAFNALEADFFAREADLYKDQAGDNFDDLEHSADGRGRRPRTSTPRGTKKR
jgi:CheY-like chemotaxis protein